MQRKLVSILACRVKSTRLYAKPLQLLDIERELSVLDYIIKSIETCSSISTVALAVSEAPGNSPFHEVAEKYSLPLVVGGEEAVLKRHLDAAELAGATDAFITTSESPFIYLEGIAEAWERHCGQENDVTAIDAVPGGSGFTIMNLETLRESHVSGGTSYGGETTLYARDHAARFKIEALAVPAVLQRPDIRLTIDFPEDLILCRKVYEAFKEEAPRIPLGKIIEFLDGNPEIKKLVEEHVMNHKLY